ncbi:hypothetical protein [Pseudomonas sp. 2848]|uniref:hypothetical protein n=1 Tax=Pseudomonas sp. 2848 TaxID=2183926 RepID=UPI0011B4A957|nr:hypothetical protein [Pseudomonas sp. 2848]
MGFEARPLCELLELIDSGVSIEMPVTGREIDELCKLAVRAGEGEGQLILKSASTLSTSDLRAIGAYANGRVLFKD